MKEKQPKQGTNSRYLVYASYTSYTPLDVAISSRAVKVQIGLQCRPRSNRL